MAQDDARIESFVNSLAEEFGEGFDHAELDRLMRDSLARLSGGATVGEFVPLMAYRFTRERLRSIDRAAQRAPGDVADVVFVSLSGGGRGQIAAALTKQLAGVRVSVHSAGTAITATIDTGVATVLREIGIDPESEFARPVTDEILHAADVIVTLGHSVSVFDIPPDIRHEDWRVGDPVGAPIEEIRRVREDIERRVQALLQQLNIQI